MPYATTQDLLESFGSAEMQQLSDIEHPALESINQVVTERALTNASDLMDAYLMGRYALPLANPPAALRVHCCGVARYLLMTNNPDERAKSDYAGAMAFLKSVAAGTVALMPPAEAQVPQGIGPVMFSTGSKVFGRSPD